MAGSLLVQVVLLTEAGCPYCQAAISGPINDLIGNASEIIDFQQFPFGNNYYASTECGGEPYNASTRHCWAQMCTNSTPVVDDCFSPGSIVPQHGKEEVEVNRLEACAKYLASDWQQYWPYLYCMEVNYATLGANATNLCAADAGLSPKILNLCAETRLGDAVQKSVAQNTFDHDAVPYLTVNGVYTDPDDVISAVCAAYGNGPSPPAICSSFLLSSSTGAQHLRSA